MERTERRAATRPLAFFVASTFLFWASMYVYVPVLPLYVQQSGAPLSVVGLVVGAYGVTQLLLRIPLGVWSDRLGRRKPFIAAGMWAAALGALGLAVWPDPWPLFFSRALTGVGASSWVAFTVLFSAYYPPGRAVRAMSLITLVNGLAQMTSTYAGGWLAQTLGMAAPFYAGAILAALGYLCTLGFGEQVQPAAAALTPRHVASIMSVPLLLAVSLIAILSQYAVFIGPYTFVPIFAEQMGATRADQGTLTTVGLLAYTLAMLITSQLVDRIGDRLTVALGMGLTALAFFATPFTTSLFVLGTWQAILGCGRGLSFPVLMGLSIRAVPQEQRATAMGVFQAVYALGMFVGPLAGGPIADNCGLAAVFYSTGAISLAAVLLALFTIPPRQG